MVFVKSCQQTNKQTRIRAHNFTKAQQSPLSQLNPISIKTFLKWPDLDFYLDLLQIVLIRTS